MIAIFRPWMPPCRLTRSKYAVEPRSRVCPSKAEGPDCTFDTPMTMGGSSIAVLDGAVRQKCVSRHASRKTARVLGQAANLPRVGWVVPCMRCAHSHGETLQLRERGRMATRRSLF